ncbi:GDSL-type esterase/lipase family protein [Pedobacter sp. AW1-32]|uniref:GDSL-type esterase/lipase family protein n=1 Tax=Pedobacter sp. AW1-32 TaxID=3383026 RepID=UPI003FEF8644
MKINYTLLLLLCGTFSAYAQKEKDWANIKRYESANEKVGPFADSAKGVIYMGDSITDFWIKVDSTFWAGKPYLDRGISGQTTTQMLVRFRQDVINLKPKAVVILAGINDIAENNGPIKTEDIFGNIKSMAILAKEAKIKVILCSVLPANKFRWRPEINPVEKIAALNALIQNYAKENKITYVDYFSKMADEEKGLSLALAKDGVHPTLAGYQVMDTLIEKAIHDTLK